MKKNFRKTGIPLIPYKKEQLLINISTTFQVGIVQKRMRFAVVNVVKFLRSQGVLGSLFAFFMKT